MIRNWISANATHDGLQQALGQMKGGDGKKKPTATGPSKGDIGRLVSRLRGGRIQRSKGSRGRRQ